MVKKSHNKRKLYFNYLTLENLNTYKVERERNAIVSLKEALENKNFYGPVKVDIHFLECQSYRYVFICNLKKFGISTANTILFAQYYEGCHGNRYFMWHQSPNSD